MPIISTVGRRSFKTRALVAAIYALLCSGGITMVYPFLLMLSGTTKSNVDTPDSQIVPDFWRSDDGLYKRFAEGLFNESVQSMNSCWSDGARSFRLLKIPQPMSREKMSEGNSRIVEDWEAFIGQNDFPSGAWILSFSRVKTSKNVYPENLRLFRKYLKDKYKTFEKFQSVFNDDNITSWNKIVVMTELMDSRSKAVLKTPLMHAFTEFALTRPLWQRCYFNAGYFYENQYLKNRYGKNIKDYNTEHQTTYSSWKEVVLSRKCEGTQPQKKDWEEFVRSVLSLQWIRIDSSEQKSYTMFLEAKYSHIGELNKQYGSGYTNFSEVRGFTGREETGAVYADWASYLRGWKNPINGKLHRAKLEGIYLETVSTRFQDWLKAKYKDITKLNGSYQSSFSRWNDIQPPQQLYQTQKFYQYASSLRSEFTFRNYNTVFDTVLINGRAVVNTIIYCALSIFLALLINPLAAYALSRYKPPSAYKVLLFLMLTMAFPPMVTQIPVFLMMREFGMLNTYWALVLPSIANGYSIFLLKGFFDSLPRELYEAAEIDGAGEFRIFWQITMSLSKPILAVIALGAFTSAYSNFMMALLICQDKSMWTLMPWLYQLQQESTQGVVFASLIIAAIPTFMVFVFCQNIIMRGIVVPVEK